MPMLTLALRWRILALLFFVRMGLAVQFQMVGAISPEFEARFEVSLTDIGLLIGLYFAPGIFLAVPGGVLGRVFGDVRVVLAGLALMVSGGVLMASTDVWAAQLAGRTLSGIGGVLLNVLLTKLVADWFAGREISFAMAIFVNSWPIGIALALIGLPLLVTLGGFALALWTVTMCVALGFVALWRFYPGPQEQGDVADARLQPSASGQPVRPADTPTGPLSGSASGDIPQRLRGAMLGASLTAGAIWGIYNAGLVTVFSFGPQLYVSRGLSLSEAGSMTSLILWGLAGFGALAGFLADRSGRRLLFIALGNGGFAAAACAAAVLDQVWGPVLLMAMFSGVAVGAMVSLPALVLPPAVRGLGMGLFFTVYYAGIALAPSLAGYVSDLAGIAATFRFAAGCLLVSVCLVPVFHILERRVSGASAAGARNP